MMHIVVDGRLGLQIALSSRRVISERVYQSKSCARAFRCACDSAHALNDQPFQLRIS